MVLILSARVFKCKSFSEHTSLEQRKLRWSMYTHWFQTLSPGGITWNPYQINTRINQYIATLCLFNEICIKVNGNPAENILVHQNFSKWSKVTIYEIEPMNDLCSLIKASHIRAWLFAIKLFYVHLMECRLTVGLMENYAKKLRNDRSPGIWVLIWEYSARSF